MQFIYKDMTVNIYSKTMNGKTQQHRQCRKEKGCLCNCSIFIDKKTDQKNCNNQTDLREFLNLLKQFSEMKNQKKCNSATFPELTNDYHLLTEQFLRANTKF